MPRLSNSRRIRRANLGFFLLIWSYIFIRSSLLLIILYLVFWSNLMFSSLTCYVAFSLICNFTSTPRYVNSRGFVSFPAMLVKDSRNNWRPKTFNPASNMTWPWIPPRWFDFVNSFCGIFPSCKWQDPVSRALLSILCQNSNARNAAFRKFLLLG